MRDVRLSIIDEPRAHDLAIASCGYEARSTYFLQLEGRTFSAREAIGYGSHECLSFSKNKTDFESEGFYFSRVDDSNFPEFISKLIIDSSKSALRDGDAPFRVFIDISCMTRYRLAHLIEALCKIDVDATFFYSLAKFDKPEEVQPLNEFFEPVSPFFSGWSGDIDKPTAVISGLGYEYMRAIGIIDHLDAANTWLFFPRSPIGEYDGAVEQANQLLLRDMDPSHVLNYMVFNFPDLCRDLFALSSSLRLSYRCVILPLGPKLFALASLLAGAAYDELAIWRVSAGEHALPSERLPSGQFNVVTVRFRS